jgi:hypothetical protein
MVPRFYGIYPRGCIFPPRATCKIDHRAMTHSLKSLVDTNLLLDSDTNNHEETTCAIGVTLTTAKTDLVESNSQPIRRNFSCTHSVVGFRAR